MVQIMESWFLADPNNLVGYFGPDFKPDKLLKPVNSKDVECHEKSTVLKTLDAALKDCQPDGYAKSDGWEILALIDPAQVCKASHFARELRDRLIALLPERA